MLSAICFDMDQSKLLLSGNGLTLSQTTNFELFKSEKSLKTTILHLRRKEENCPKG